MAFSTLSKPLLSFPAPPSVPLALRATALVFEDVKSKALLERIHLIGPSAANVLITGETGTGKELIARHLHALSVGTNISKEILSDEQAREHSIHPLLAQRRSWKAFSTRILEPETLGLLLEAARWAPSCMNEQPWSFIVATKQNPSQFNGLLGCLHEFNVQWAQHAAALILSVARLTFASNGESGTATLSTM
jgi:hypothetical protein